MSRLNLTQAMEIDDLRGKSRQQLMDILAPIRDAANKRLNRLNEAGQTSAPAYQAAMESGGKIYGSKYNSIKELKAEILRGKAIIKYKTSTVTGAKKFQKRMTGQKPTGKFFSDEWDPDRVPDYGDLSPSQVGDYWKIMHKLQELGQTSLSSEMYNSMKALVRTAVSSASPEDAVNNLMNSFPAASHEYIMNEISQKGGFVTEGETRLVDNALAVIDSYLNWRTENGYLGNENEKETEEDSDFVWL